MSVIVITEGQKVTIERGVKWTTSPMALDIIGDDGNVIATFRKWESVHIPREEKTVGPFTEGAKSPCDAVDWQRVLQLLQANPSEVHAHVIVRALQQAQLYVMQQANSTESP